MNKFLLFFLSLVLGSNLMAQKTAEKLVASIDSFSLLRPQEKAYLQTDRNTYIKGESVHFKAYVILNEKPTILSNIVYADVVNENGEIVDKKMLKLMEGVAFGSFDLKQSFITGNYYIRCYTLWMLNFPDFIFEKKIRIISTVSSFQNTQKQPPKITCTFYPEGGDLVNGLNSKVAFKALTHASNEDNVTGNIVTGDNKIIASFTSNHNGMGTFEITPKEGEIYKVNLSYAGIKEQTFILPLAKKEGIILSVDNSNLNKTFVRIERGETNKEAYNNLIIVAQINNRIAYLGKLNMDEGLDAVAINKKQLPAGVMQISVLAENGNPLAERLVFVANYASNSNILKPEIINTEKRKKNTITLDLNEYKNLSAAISITNAAVELEAYSNNILSALLLTDDLKGYVKNPAYYFKDKDTSTLKKLDLVMLTNGWRRFRWDEIMSNKFSELKYPFERGLNISGKVLQSNGKSVLKEAKINLIINGEDSTKILSEASTNENSAFVVDNIDFKKEATIYYQGTNTKNKEAIVAVNFNPSYFDLLQKANLNSLEADTVAESNFLLNVINNKNKLDSTQGKTLQTVIVKTKRRSVTDSLNLKYASDFFYDSDQTLSLNGNLTYFDMWQYLRSAVPGILISNSDTGTQVSFTRYQGLNFFSENESNNGVQFYLNEIPVTNDIVESLSVADVGLVKIFKGTTAIALGATNGAIAIYTIKDKSFRDWRTKGFDFIKRSGYSVSREFYEIDYLKINAENNFIDVRPTIYWNPAILIKEGKAIIDFYNDDACKSFKIVVEGIDENGKILHAESVIK